MLLHFIFVVREEDLHKRRQEFEYVEKMAKFYQAWMWDKFKRRYDVRCDEMITKPRSLLQRIDTHTLLNDHKHRGAETYHFYLTHFRPTWTDCTCEGYHAENFGMIFWNPPGDADGELFLQKRTARPCHTRSCTRCCAYPDAKGSSKTYMTCGPSTSLAAWSLNSTGMILQRQTAGPPFLR